MSRPPLPPTITPAPTTLQPHARRLVLARNKIGSVHRKVNSIVVLEEFSKIVYEIDEDNYENYGITKVTEMT